MEEFRKLLQHRVVKEEMKKRDVSAQQREAAVDFLVEGGIWRDPKQERALTEALRKKEVHVLSTHKSLLINCKLTTGHPQKH